MPEENLADPTADVKEEDKVPLLSGDAEAPAENGKSATVFGAIRTLVGGSNGELRIPVELEYEKNFTVFFWENYPPIDISNSEKIVPRWGWAKIPVLKRYFRVEILF